MNGMFRPSIRIRLLLWFGFLLALFMIYALLAMLEPRPLSGVRQANGADPVWMVASSQSALHSA